MSVAEPNLYDFLKGHSLPCGDRIYYQRAPEKAPDDFGIMPCVVYLRAGDQRDGTFCTTDSLVGANYQLDCFSTDPEGAKDLGNAIWNALRDYRGPMGSVTVHQVMLTSSLDIGPDVEPGLYRRTLLFLIWYWED